MWYRRCFWLQRIEEAWQKRSLVWLAGVRRVGKTVLAQTLEGVEYFDCELPRVRRMLRDPEWFWAQFVGKRVVLDEVHRLADPALVLKVAADHFPQVKVLATGSSTLASTRKFRDTLVGRRQTVILTPMVWQDLQDFGRVDLVHRLRFGGLPSFFLAERWPERDFQDWLDGFWAKDVAELFRLERRDSFLRFVELLLAQSGGIFQATALARQCEVTHNTTRNYLAVLETTLVAHRVRPFSRRTATEIVAAPKVYAFDTGFVVAFKGWGELRDEDLGLLWEHFVLNEVQGVLAVPQVYYWRDKRGHEVDFVFPRREKSIVAVECKWRAENFSPKNLLAFRRRFPQGQNLVVAADVERPWEERFGSLRVTFLGLQELVARLALGGISGDHSG